MSEKNLPKSKIKIFEEVLVLSRRRCAICFGLNHDNNVKKGQIAHLDGNRKNNDLDNLAFLCFDHHDEYDSTTSQSKSLQLNEVKTYRQELYQNLEQSGFAEIIPLPEMDLLIFTAGGFKDHTIYCQRGRPKTVRFINPVEQLVTQAQLPYDVYLRPPSFAKLTLHEFIKDGLLISEDHDTDGIVVDMEIYYARPAFTS